MKKVILVILGFFALLAAYPVLFLAAGSLMGKQELAGYLAPVLAKGGGYAAFRLFPMYPTLRAYVELLLDSPGYFYISKLLHGKVHRYALYFIGFILFQK